jgi:hypothetical protein
MKIFDSTQGVIDSRIEFFFSPFNEKATKIKEYKLFMILKILERRREETRREENLFKDTLLFTNLKIISLTLISNIYAQ